MQQEGRLSVLVDDAFWANAAGQRQQSGLHPLGGDAGPMVMEQSNTHTVAWDEEEAPAEGAVPSSPPHPLSTLAPGAII